VNSASLQPSRRPASAISTTSSGARNGEVSFAGGFANVQ
jgi:hypothetical protein